MSGQKVSKMVHKSGINPSNMQSKKMEYCLGEGVCLASNYVYVYCIK